MLKDRVDHQSVELIQHSYDLFGGKTLGERREASDITEQYRDVSSLPCERHLFRIFENLLHHLPGDITGERLLDHLFFPQALGHLIESLH